MTDDVLTPALPTEGLSAEDAAVFERVWHRVMAGREQEQTALVPAGQPPAPPAPVGQTDGLLEQLRAHTTGWRATQSLARKAGGSMARVLSGMAADERRQLARLAAAWYITTGQRWRPEAGSAGAVPDLMEGLRQKYLHLQSAARMLEQAAQVGEETFNDLYADLAAHSREHAGVVLRLLEQMQL
ncbi:MAG: hypothetical protein IJA11_00440 [Oscillospiraceae bacterium]|nr:hypothetical protein [Oscillospiraceae bacterium]